MKYRVVSALRRLVATVTILLLLGPQLALPAFALTQDEINAMPTVTLYYQTTADGEQQAIAATPTEDSMGKAYWAMLPGEAFSYPITLSVMASMVNPAYTFTPTDGSTLAVDVATVDYSGTFTTIVAYQDGNAMEQYNLYVSTVEMPVTVEPVSIPVTYVDADNPSNILYSTTFTAYYDQENVVYADTGAVPSGYVLQGDNAAYVTVDEYGTASPSSITFYFSKPVVQGSVTIYYEDTDGNELAGPQTETLDPGTYTYTVDTGMVPDGYTLTSASEVQVTVGDDGTTTPEAVVFTFAKPVVQGTVTIYYVDTKGNTLAGPQTETLDPGTYTYTADAAMVPDGYTLTSASEVQVTVSEDGTTSPDTVVFTYEAPVSQGMVSIYYVDTKGNTLAGPQTETLDPGTYTYTADAAMVPDGYTLTSASEVQVTVGEDGTTTPDTVMFTYQAPASQGFVSIYYVDTKGNTLAGPQTETLDPGTYTYTADAAMVPDGYTLTSASEVQVTVGEDGTTTPDTVMFTYQAPEVTDTETPTPAPVETAVNRYATVNQVANFRTETSTDSTKAFANVPTGTYVWVYNLLDVTESDGTVRTWAHIHYSDTDCYVWASLIDILSQEDSDTYNYAQETAVPGTETEPPADTDTPAPTDTLAPAMTPINRYAVVNVVANFRTEASTDSTKAFANVASGTYVWVYGTLDVAESDGTLRTWAYIHYSDTDCYVWASLVDILSQEDSDAYNYAQATPVPGTETEAPTDTPEVTATPTDAPTDTPTEAPTDTPTPTPTPAQVTGFYLTLDEAPVAEAAGSETLVTTLPADTVVFVEGQEYVDSVAWHRMTTDNGRTGYIQNDYLRPLTEEEMAEYVYTPTPSPTPTETPTATPTETPTATPTETVTVTVTPTEMPMYMGYGVTTTQTALRNGASLDDATILMTLPADTLLYLNQQITVNSIVWSGAQTVLGTSVIGVVQDSAVKYITEEEAQVYIKAYNDAHATPTPSPTPTPTPIPAQSMGYYITLGDVPMRSVANTYADISTWVAEDTVLYVAGQVYNEDYGWHITSYNDYVGYVRTDQMRKLSAAEEAAYIETLASVSPTPSITPQPYDPYADSSYGYVSASSVNFRAAATTSSTRLAVLRQYAFALVLGSRVVDGYTWYNINYGGTVGWVDARYFTVLNLTELTTFLNSSEYLQGITNNSSSSTTTSSGTSGSATQGSVSSVEDWNKDLWQNPSSSLSASYEPFNPYTTATPTPTPEGGAAGALGDGDATPTPTFVIGTMIPISYEDETKETESGSGWAGLALGGAALLAAAGGVYAYALNQNKKRRTAARNAAYTRRATQQGTQPGAATTSSPYTRRAVAAPPVSGATKREDEKGVPPSNPYAAGGEQRPAPNRMSGSAAVPPAANQNPYARPAGAPNPYARPAGEQPTTPVTGSTAGVAPGSASVPQTPETPVTPPQPPQSAQPTQPTQPTQPAQQAETYTPPSPANPYATPKRPATGSTEQMNPTPRRTSRTSRYYNDDQDNT